MNLMQDCKEKKKNPIRDISKTFTAIVARKYFPYANEVNLEFDCSEYKLLLYAKACSHQRQQVLKIISKEEPAAQL